jgi:hypothetical protein
MKQTKYVTIDLGTIKEREAPRSEPQTIQISRMHGGCRITILIGCDPDEWVLEDTR